MSGYSALKASSVSDFKARLRTSSVVRHVLVERSDYPELNGIRRVMSANTVGVSLALPVDHPRAHLSTGSWTRFDQQDQSYAMDDGSLIITLDNGHTARLTLMVTS